MSGHSKWSTIKRKKGAIDAKRGVIFTRISKDITIAARQGGGDDSMNPALRLAVKAAKSANMPAANIERAIKKGTGDLPGMSYEDALYEGYGPGGVAIMMEILTDNKNRTLPEIRHLMSKNGGNLGESGCVNWMFEKKGTITVSKEDAEEESLMEAALDLGAEDFAEADDYFVITTSPEEFDAVSSGLEAAGINVESGVLGLEPINTVKVEGSEAKTLLILMEILEEHDDVQKLYANFDIDDEDIEDED